MEQLSHHQVVVMFLGLGVLLATARALGEVAKRLGQPMVLGELLAGILLGPTVLGALAPDVSAMLFPLVGDNAKVLHGLTTLSVALFLLVAGMEVDLSSVWRQGRTALIVSATGIVVPFVLAFLAGYWAPNFLGRGETGSDLLFATFFATVLAVSSLAIIAKTLMDLNLYRSDFGMMVVTAAILGDVTGWIIFALVLGLAGGPSAGPGIVQTLWMTLGFAALVLTVGRWAVDRVLPWLQAHSTWPGGVLSFALALALLGAALTEQIGMHAIFGAFLFGVAMGDSRHLRTHTRTVIDQFVSFIFAPLFFGSIGLHVDFLAYFDPLLVLVVVSVAFAGKILGTRWGAQLARLPRREGWSAGFALNDRGAMAIILAMLGTQAGLASERLFVALVLMALTTSIVSGPAVRRLLRLRRRRHFTKYAGSKTFVRELSAANRNDAIRELALVLSSQSGIAGHAIAEAVLAREAIMSTGLGNGVAVPHARLASLSRPLVAVGFSRGGLDFDAPDGELSRVVIVILTGEAHDGAQIELLADIATTFRSKETVRRLIQAATYTEFLALVKSQQTERSE